MESLYVHVLQCRHAAYNVTNNMSLQNRLMDNYDDP